MPAQTTTCLFRQREQRKGALTCQVLLAHLECVEHRRGDASHGANHAAQAQVDEHEEEHDGPEGRGWEIDHGLSEGNEGQASPLYCLERTHSRQKTGRQKDRQEKGGRIKKNRIKQKRILNTFS